MLPFFDDYHHAKNLSDWLIPSRDIDDQRTLPSDWLTAFQATAEKKDFSQICDFCRIIKNTAMNLFRVKNIHR